MDLISMPRIGDKGVLVCMVRLVGGGGRIEVAFGGGACGREASAQY